MPGVESFLLFPPNYAYLPHFLRQLFPKPDYGKTPSKKKEMPEGLWTKCPECSAYIFNKELESLQMVCKECGHHFNITAHQRLHHLLDEGSWQEFDEGVSSVDVLKFTGATSYSDQLKKYQKKTASRKASSAGWARSMATRSRWR